MIKLTTQGLGDYFILAGKRSPGLCDISGCSDARKWDKLQGYGYSGGFCRYRGKSIGEFTIKVRLYGDPFRPDPDWAAWQRFRPVLARPPSGQEPKMLDIWHPWLEELEIKSVGVVEVSAPEQTADGEWTIAIKFIEFRKPKFSLVKPEASKAKESNDPYQRTIERLTGVVQELADG